MANCHLLNLSDNQTLDVPGVGEIEAYQITKHSHLASMGLSEVYLANVSNLKSYTVVKVLKTKSPGVSGEVTGSIVGQAESWLYEYTIQKQLQHVCPVHPLLF